MIKKRNKYGVISGIIGIISNLILFIMKLVIGMLSNSISIITDGINNLSDIFTSLFTVVGFKLTDKTPTKYHPYGFARFEYISGFAVSLFMLFTGFLLLKEGVYKIINKETLSINNITFIILIISILIKIIQMVIYKRNAKLISSKTLLANSKDARNDVISTSSILISMIIMKKFNINIDGYLGVILSTIIISSSVKMIEEVLQPIIGITPSKKQVNLIEKKLKSYNYVKGFHDLVIHNYGYNNDFVTVHIEIDSKLDMLTAHDLMDNIENDFKEELNMDLTIHMDPVIIGDKKVDKLKKLVLDKIKDFDKDLNIHDFRVIENKKNITVLFDVVIPYDKKYNNDDISKYLYEGVIPDKKPYIFIIEMDRPYI